MVNAGVPMCTEIDRLVMDKDITQVCPFYLDLQGEGQRLQVNLLTIPGLNRISCSLHQDSICSLTADLAFSSVH